MKLAAVLLAMGATLSFSTFAVDFNEEGLAKLQKNVLNNTKGTEMKLPTNKCLDVAGDAKSNGATLQIWDCNGSANQLWKIDTKGRIINTGGKCIDVAGDVAANGTKVHLWDCHDGANQKWKRDGERWITSGGKCLDADGSADKNGTRIHLWDCNGGNNQKWRQ